eukprot:6619830-Pyramimonas_sp.AAC.1
MAKQAKLEANISLQEDLRKSAKDCVLWMANVETIAPGALRRITKPKRSPEDECIKGGQGNAPKGEHRPEGNGLRGDVEAQQHA